MAENIESLEDLNAILTHYDKDPATFPTVIQYNKCDLPDVAPIEKLRATLERRRASRVFHRRPHR